jgi:hypothetical protein
MNSLLCASLTLLLPVAVLATEPDTVDATTIHHKVMCGYQGWFKTPGDGTGLGWSHWSWDPNRVRPSTVNFEMWPDLTGFPPQERYPVPGFTYPDGTTAELFSANNPATVLRHFQWMRDYGIDGVWLQRFVIGLPGVRPEFSKQYQPYLDVLHYTQEAARQTGRTWAISYDAAKTPTDKIYDALVSDWKKMVDDKVTADPRYLHEGGLPVVQIWGFYYKNSGNLITPEVGNKLIDFFKQPGPYRAYLVGGGNWDSSKVPDPQWQAMYQRFDAYTPWNIGNFSRDKAGVTHASMGWWAVDRQTFESRGQFWIPTVYPGFGWNNLTKTGASDVSRRGGQFLWEQFHELSKMGVDTVYVAMFDEVNEGTAIFKVTNNPPTEAKFVGYEGLPSDWYLRLVGLGEKMLREKQSIPPQIPIKPS